MSFVFWVTGSLGRKLHEFNWIHTTWQMGSWNLLIWMCTTETALVFCPLWDSEETKLKAILRSMFFQYCKTQVHIPAIVMYSCCCCSIFCAVSSSCLLSMPFLTHLESNSCWMPRQGAAPLALQPLSGWSWATWLFHPSFPALFFQKSILFSDTILDKLFSDFFRSWFFVVSWNSLNFWQKGVNYRLWQPSFWLFFGVRTTETIRGHHMSFISQEFKWRMWMTTGWAWGFCYQNCWEFVFVFERCRFDKTLTSMARGFSNHLPKWL